MATPFGYNDRVWSKYGAAIAQKLEFNAKTAIEAVHRNPLNARPNSAAVKNHAPTLTSLAQKVVRFAICGMATAGIAGMVAKLVGGNVGDIHHEFATNLIDSAFMVPAGIVVVNRAQEHGYALAYVGYGQLLLNVTDGARGCV
jgi:intracellular sulfur oxidation DsrE/DsrF family protein